MTQGTDCIKDLERELRELRQANDIVKKGSSHFTQAERDRPNPT
jgi:transposase